MSRMPSSPTPRSRAPLPSDIEARLSKTWKQAYAATSRDELLQLYSDWAGDYDQDHEVIGFVGHRTAAAALARHIPDRSARILDAGAGTGAAGVALKELGYSDLTGLDLSADMLDVAATKGVYNELHPADLGLPVDRFRGSTFDAAILVGVFSFGQAPASTLDEVVRLVRPGGLITFTMRTDFFDADPMGVRVRMGELTDGGAWEEIEVTDPAAYLPKKDPDVKFRVWSYRVLPGKIPPVEPDYADAIRTAFADPNPVKALDHRYIWNALGSRMYNRYIATPDYYLNDCEEEILRDNAAEIVRNEDKLIELGCGSGRKVSLLLSEEARRHTLDQPIDYIPIDLSPAALEWAKAEVEAKFGERVTAHPRHGCFSEALPAIAAESDRPALIVFFGSSIGNFETLDETVEFLAMVRKCMRPTDRFLVGMDLHKDADVLRRAYQSGEPNLTFFLNMVRRINDDAGADFDLTQFVQDSSYTHHGTYRGQVEDWRVEFKLKTNVDQTTRVEALDLDVGLNAGDSVRAGISRKFRKGDIAALAELAGLRLSRQWTDRRDYFSVNEFVTGDAP